MATVKNISPFDLEIPSLRLTVAAGASIEVPDDVAGHAPKKDRKVADPESDEGFIEASEQGRVRQGEDAWFVVDLGSGLLAQTENFQAVKATANKKSES